MLPPKELHNTCLRCSHPLEEGERYCPGCGADREVELAIAAELNPAVAALRKWLWVLGAISLGMALLLYEHFREVAASEELLLVVTPGVVQAVVLFALSAFARRWPLGVSVVALILYVASTLLQLITHGLYFLSPSLGMVLRLMFLIVLVGAVNAGMKARTLRRRAREDFPSARARYV